MAFNLKILQHSSFVDDQYQCSHNRLYIVTVEVYRLRGEAVSAWANTSGFAPDARDRKAEAVRLTNKALGREAGWTYTRQEGIIDILTAVRVEEGPI